MIINNTVGRGGSSGKDGITPHIGDNGNWFLGTEDTGVVAKAQGNTKIAEVTLLAANWDESLAQTIACEGISANEANQMVTLLPALANKAVYSSCRVTCTAFAENSLTFMAESLPEEDILVYVAMEDEHASVANDIYSLEETVIGTWIDGKPIYRRTFVANVVGVAKLTEVLISQDINSATHPATSIQGVAYNQKWGFQTPISYLYVSDSDNCHTMIAPSYHSGGLTVNMRDIELNQWTLTLTVEYTKAADVATIDIPAPAALMDAYEEGVNES